MLGIVLVASSSSLSVLATSSGSSSVSDELPLAGCRGLPLMDGDQCDGDRWGEDLGVVVLDLELERSEDVGAGEDGGGSLRSRSTLSTDDPQS